MRLQISLEDDLVAVLDRRVGRRRPGSFIAEALRAAMDDARRWDRVERAVASIPDTGHEWDRDPGAWVRNQRRADARRAG